MRKHRLSASFASSAVAAGAVIGTAIVTGQPASAAPAGPKPASLAVDHLVLAAVPTAPAAPTFGRELTLTSPFERGADVRTLQSRYEAHGFHLAIDGIFGPETEGVTKAFQVSKGLAADGVVGPRTWAAAFDQQVSSGPPVVHQDAPAVAFTVPPVHHTVTFAAPATAPTQHAVASSSGSGAAGGVWSALRQCESGGNYSTSTGNGFQGAYQFSQATWSGIGMTGSPGSASPAMQDAAAKKLQAQSGWSQWPACSAKLGLR